MGKSKAITQSVFKHEGIRLNYYTLGKGKPLLFLHGGGARAMQHKKLLKMLSKRYMVIAPDMPFFGYSSSPKDIWDIGKFAELYLEFIKSLKLIDLTVIGHSLGGAIGMEICKYKQDINKLILINSVGTSYQYSVFRFYFDLFLMHAFHEPFIYKNFLGMLDFSYSLSLSIIKNISQLGILVLTIRDCMRYDSFKSGIIRCNTLILWGKKEMFLPKSFLADQRTNIPNARFEYIDGNHDWIWFEPEILEKYL